MYVVVFSHRVFSLGILLKDLRKATKTSVITAVLQTHGIKVEPF
jgi:hypothetical protein